MSSVNLIPLSDLAPALPPPGDEGGSPAMPRVQCHEVAKLDQEFASFCSRTA
jgi:hypothetical protein